MLFLTSYLPLFHYYQYILYNSFLVSAVMKNEKFTLFEYLLTKVDFSVQFYGFITPPTLLRKT